MDDKTEQNYRRVAAACDRLRQDLGRPPRTREITDYLSANGGVRIRTQTLCQLRNRWLANNPPVPPPGIDDILAQYPEMAEAVDAFVVSFGRILADQGKAAVSEMVTARKLVEVEMRQEADQRLAEVEARRKAEAEAAKAGRDALTERLGEIEAQMAGLRAQLADAEEALQSKDARIKGLEAELLEARSQFMVALKAFNLERPSRRSTADKIEAKANR